MAKPLSKKARADLAEKLRLAQVIYLAAEIAHKECNELCNAALQALPAYRDDMTEAEAIEWASQWDVIDDRYQYKLNLDTFMKAGEYLVRTAFDVAAENVGSSFAVGAAYALQHLDELLRVPSARKQAIALALQLRVN